MWGFPDDNKQTLQHKKGNHYNIEKTTIFTGSDNHSHNR